MANRLEAISQTPLVSKAANLVQILKMKESKTAGIASYFEGFLISSFLKDVPKLTP
jgi:hypothetical protein